MTCCCMQAKRGDFGPVADAEREARERARRILSRRADRLRARDRERLGAADLSPRDARRRRRDALFGYHRAQEGRGGDGARPAAGRAGEPRQERFSRQYEPRAAHPAQCHHRVLGGDRARAARARSPTRGNSNTSRTSTRAGCCCCRSSTTCSTCRRSRPGCCSSPMTRSGCEGLSTRRFASFGERARARKLDLVADLPDGDLLLIGDERALKQVLLNLLSNAIKFSHEGGRVEIRAWRGSGRGGRDRSRGLRDRHEPGRSRPRLAAVRPGQFGNGAKLWRHRASGLPIAKGLIDAHRGTLSIDSSPGRGTAVRIMLPRRPVRADPLGPAAGSRKQRTRPPTAPPSRTSESGSGRCCAGGRRTGGRRKAQNAAVPQA